VNKVINDGSTHLHKGYINQNKKGQGIQSMLKIVMDTAGDLCPGWQEKYNIEIMPVNIIHNGVSYQQGIDIQYDDFYKIVENEHVIPATSQPTPYQFIDFYKKIAKPSDTVLSIHITDKLSGTLNSARQAAEELKGTYNIIPFDSESGSICMGMMCKEARLMDMAGKSIDEIMKKLTAIRQKMELVFTIDTLKFAKLSGRVKSIQASLASLLDIKPIIELQDGQIEVREKVRSRKASLEKMIFHLKQKVGNRPVHIAIVHAHDPTTGKAVMDEVRQSFNCVELAFAEISITLAVHFGPGTIGIAAYED